MAPDLPSAQAGPTANGRNKIAQSAQPEALVNESVDTNIDPPTSIAVESVVELSGLGSPPGGFQNSDGVVTSVRPLSVFVMMPYGAHDEYKEGVEESNFIYRHVICQGVEMACRNLKRKHKIIRETDNRASGSITASIVRNTVDSDIAIVDITGMNPNVFFELGIRYALRRSTTILLRNQDSRIPFDVNVYRAITYRKLQFEAAAKELAEAMTHAMTTQGGYSDSLVYDVFSNLEVRIPNVYDSSEASERGHSNIMPWSEFFQRIKDVVETLKDAVTNGRYQPDVILGISNGGLIVMDLLGRELHLHKPLLALWADRQAGLDMFESDWNSATLETIKSKNTSDKNKDKKMEILLVDDIVATSQTIELAKKFLEEKLGPHANIRFLPLFNRSQKNREVLRGLLLYDDKRFQLTEEQKIRLMTTSRTILPYNKNIRD